MEKRAYFSKTRLPYLLILPQTAVILLFFYWPAAQALFQSFLLADPFGQRNQFVWFNNFIRLFQDALYWKAIGITFVFSAATAVLSIATGLLIATMANRALKAKAAIRTLLILPYAVAPAVSGILWLFLFHPSYGVIAHVLIHWFGIEWNPILNGTHALILVIVASAWKEISYNFVFFMAGLQSVPKSLIEAAAIDGAGPMRRFWVITFPLLSPTLFFLLVMNVVYAFFETFGVIHTVTQGGPGGATLTMVYKVYKDGFVGLDLGSSAAQSVILMLVIISLTLLQFKYVEKKVQYV
ncbi:MAG: sn-glycerol-3-phosphate ABC transporter permease UgpA [Thermodesulfobacteriota bacterium]